MAQHGTISSVAPHPPGHAAHGDRHYVKIWGVLLALLVVSVVGPMLGHPVLTLITAFGIALVKAFLVARNFMHLNIEKKWVGLMLLGMIAFVVLYFGGVAPDVMQHDGHRWENVSAKKATQDAQGAAGAQHGGGH